MQLNLLAILTPSYNDESWPGDEEVIDTEDCPDISIRPVFAFLDNSGEWQYVEYEDYAANVQDWISNEWEFHAATLIDCDGDIYIVSNSFVDVQKMLDICCATLETPTLALAMKQSPASLNPNEPNPKCQEEAIFKWLALYGKNENRTLEYAFSLTLTSEDSETTLSGAFELGAFNATQQETKSCPADFIGLNVGMQTIVADDAVPGPNDIKVGTFGRGTLQVEVIIREETSPGTWTQILNDAKTFRLPATSCQEEYSIINVTVNAGQATSLSIDGEAVQHVSGSNFPIPTGQSGVFRSTKNGTGFDVAIGRTSGGTTVVTDSAGAITDRGFFAAPGIHTISNRTVNPSAAVSIVVDGFA